MFKNSKAFSSFSVDDLEKAKTFYQSVLGLEVKDNPMGVFELHIHGSSPVVIYPKPNHEPASFTVLNFPVENVEEMVRELKAQGIAFEHYDVEGLKTDEDGISRAGGHVVAWFKDPAGNILSIMKTT